MTTTVIIRAPASDVFALVTNASRWPCWHPATASVRDTPFRPLVQGESVVESIRAAGRSFDARWLVVECEVPRRWVIVTDSAQGCARIEYSLAPEHAGTRFTRRLQWRSHSALWGCFDHWLTRWILDRQSRHALMNLSSLFRTQESTA